MSFRIAVRCSFLYLVAYILAFHALILYYKWEDELMVLGNEGDSLSFLRGIRLLIWIIAMNVTGIIYFWCCWWLLMGVEIIGMPLFYPTKYNHLCTIGVMASNFLFIPAMVKIVFTYELYSLMHYRIWFMLHCAFSYNLAITSNRNMFTGRQWAMMLSIGVLLQPLHHRFSCLICPYVSKHT